MPPSRLSETEIESALTSVPLWSRAGDEISRTFELESFAQAIAFVVQVGFLAEARDHHPDVDVRWRRVHLLLTTHDSGGLTELDFELAGAFDQIMSA